MRIHAAIPALLLPFLAAQNPGKMTQEEIHKLHQDSKAYIAMLEDPQRDAYQKPMEVIKALGLKEGEVVADIGAGSGWFTVRAAKRVANTGIVYALDINADAVAYIKQRIEKEQLHNVKAIVSKPGDPELPANSIDSVLLLKTYHEVADPVTLLRNLRFSLKPGARVGIIDRDGNGQDHGVQKAVVIREADEAGYRLLEEHDDLVKGDKMDYFLVFGAQ